MVLDILHISFKKFLIFDGLRRIDLLIRKSTFKKEQTWKE